MSLVPRFIYGELDLTDHPFSIEFGSDFGNPENVVDVVQTLLHDGEVLESSRRTNRVLTLTVLIEDADLLALAQAEASLIAECDKQRNTLSVEPGDGIGPTTVFETFRSQPRWERDDDMEQQGFRRFVLEIPALPHPRSTTPTTYDPSAAPSAPGTVVYPFESVVGWSKWAYTGGAAAVVDTATFVQGTGSVRTGAGVSSSAATTSYGEPFSYGSHTDQVTGLSISTSTGGYIGISVRTDYTDTIYDNYGKARQSGLQQLWVQYSGSATWVEVTFTPSEITGGFVRNVFAVGSGKTITGFRFLVDQFRHGHGHAAPNVFYDNGTLSTAATTDSSILQTFDLGGSARGPGSLHVEAPSDSVALGQVLLATVPDSEVLPGFRIDGRRWVISGATTADATALWGSYYTANVPVFEVPVSILTPGAYSIVALCASPADPITIGVTAQLRAGGVATGPVSAAEVKVPNSALAWRFVTIGTIYLPSLPMQNASPTDLVRVTFTGGDRLADWYMIPAAADFSIVDCGEGTVSASAASSHLWIDSPTPSQPRGGWWRGPLAGRVSARSAWPNVKKPARHTFPPGRVNAYLVTTKAQGPRLTLDRFDWWFGNAAS